MLNILWPIFIIISIIFAIVSGNLKELNTSIFESTNSAVSLCITLIGTMCLWNGIMEIAKKTTLIKKLTSLLKPLIKFLFPELTKNEKAKEEISMNIIANVLGLGNAATPLGLKAMKTMQKENKDKTTLSNSMAMFILINTASIQLIPTNVIAIRNSLNSTAPTQIIFPVWIATIVAAISSIMAAKVFIKMGK